MQDGSDVKENVRNWIHRCNADHRDKLLACGILIVAELRMQVLKETEFTCSAGIAHNKVARKFFSLPCTLSASTIRYHIFTNLLLSSYNFVARCWPNLQVV